MKGVFRKVSFQSVISLLIFTFGVSLAYYIAFAQVPSPPEPTEEEIAALGITFPIAELGNCANKDACRDYCNDPANIRACIAFAKSHGLMNEREASRAERFAARIEGEGGPGGCRSPQECETYCSDITHIEECVAFAEEHDVDDPEIEDAKKIAAYLRGGGVMPGGCTSRESCEAYCSDFDHAEECFEFAERAGLAVDDDFDGRGPTPEQFRQMIELMKRGETPGGCKSKNECETYCRSEAHFEECITFGERVGFIGAEEAALARRTGGRGPGGCNSHQSCEAYCNDPANQEECFKFAEEHGLIPPEELERAKEGFVRLRQGLENAPPEIAACLKSVLGPNIIEDIQAGKLVPGPQIGERVKGCFEKFGGDHSPTRVLDEAPPEVLQCVREKLGPVFDQIRSGKAFPTPEMGDAFRVCFQSFELERGGFGGPDGSVGGGPSSGELGELFRSAPSEVQLCLRNNLGDRFGRIIDGDVSALGPDLRGIIEGCFGEFRPPMHDESDSPPSDFTPSVPDFSNLPPEVLECVRGVLGPDVFERLRTGDVDPGIAESIRACFEKLQSNIIPPTNVSPEQFQEQEYEEQFAPEGNVLETFRPILNLFLR